MNDKRIKKRLLSLALVAVISVTLFSGCGGNSAVAPALAECDYIAVGTDITDTVKDTTEDVVLLENGGSSLVFSPDGIFSVMRGGNKVWSTGMPSAEVMQRGELESASAAALFKYHVNGESEKTMNSFTDAFKKSQYRVYRDGESIVYEQIAGEFSADVLLPEALSEKRFKEITDSLSESDATFLSRQYMLYTPDTATDDVLKTLPALKKGSFYVLMDAESFVKRKRLHETFEKAGYTSEDLDADRKAAGIETTDQGEVFKFVMRFTLENGELVVDVPCDQIYYPTSKPLVSIDLMKYGAFAAFGDNGSYVMPSGSGALFSFAEYKDVDYTLQYYGKDYTTENAVSAFDYSGHPLFGAIKGNGSYVGIVEQGAENIRMCIENTQNGYILYPQLQLMSYEVSGLGQTRKFYQYGQKAFTDNVRIRYSFFEGENVNYSSMAKRYGKYLLDSGALGDKNVSEKLPLQLEVINNLYMIKKTAGISYTVSQTVTTFEETENIVKYFKEQNITALSLKLNGANKRGLFAQTPGKFDFSKAAGGKKEYTALSKYCKEENVPLYLQVNLPFYYADSVLDGYSATKDTARRLNKKTAQLSYKEKSTNADRQDLPVIEIVSPSAYLDFAKKYSKASETLGDGISVGELARVLNSDFNENGAIIRSEAKKTTLESLKKLKKNYSILAESPSDYTLVALDRIEKMPLSDNGDGLWSQDIPLIPLALHGYIDYTSEYWNDQPDSKELMLKAIEYGSGIAYRFAENVTKDVMTTHNNFLFNVNFDLWKETVVDQYNYVNTALEGLNRIPMTSHIHLADDVVKTTYENGSVIYVNYGDTAVSIDGITVDAEGYYRVN